MFTPSLPSNLMRVLILFLFLHLGLQSGLSPTKDSHI
jgi:hypothetical protein